MSNDNDNAPPVGAIAELQRRVTNLELVVNEVVDVVNEMNMGTGFRQIGMEDEARDGEVPENP